MNRARKHSLQWAAMLRFTSKQTKMPLSPKRLHPNSKPLQFTVSSDPGDERDSLASSKSASWTVDQLQELAGRSYVMAYWLALIHTALNEADRAFQWIERSYQERSPTLSFLKVDPRLDNLRSDPRLGHYLRQLSLPV